MFRGRLKTDWTLLGAVYFVIALGLLLITSAQGMDLLWRQLTFVFMGTCLMLATSSIDYLTVDLLSGLLYAASVLLLAAVLVIGRTTLGAQRWLQIGPIPLQPSEVAKIALIVTLAGLIGRKEGKWSGPKDFFVPLIYAAVPMLLTLKQPDLGTTLVLAAIAFGIMFVGGCPLKPLLGLYGGGIAVGVIWVFLHLKFKVPIPLEDYQLLRLIVFTDPSMDPLDSGYQIIQSKIAIGSGRLFGKGLFLGTQNKLAFLPFRHTDFIFSVLGEELGFIGGISLLIAYIIIILRGLRIASAAKDLTGTLMATGVVSMIAFHVIVNVGMTLGLMPVTGLPLPFASYGGSSLIMNMIGIGLLLAIHSRRHKIMF
jgi:rod shape determining protein RodA